MQDNLNSVNVTTSAANLTLTIPFSSPTYVVFSNGNASGNIFLRKNATATTSVGGGFLLGPGRSLALMLQPNDVVSAIGSTTLRLDFAINASPQS